MDARTIALGQDRWLTDSRVYNLVWLGRWIERAQSIGRVLLWAAQQPEAADPQAEMERVAGMAASIRGVAVGPEESAAAALLARDSGASLRGCLNAARYNATQVAPLEVIQLLGAAIEAVDAAPPPPPSPADAAAVLRRALELLDELHTVVEEVWFHSEAISEEEVYRRFVQQQQ